MNPAQAAKTLEANSAELLKALDGVHEPALRAARAVAGTIKSQAARRGHSISVRVRETRNGVRLTITGRSANHYRESAKALLTARLPQVQAEIRTQLTRRA